MCPSPTARGCLEGSLSFARPIGSLGPKHSATELRLYIRAMGRFSKFRVSPTHPALDHLLYTPKQSGLPWEQNLSSNLCSSTQSKLSANIQPHRDPTHRFRRQAPAS